MSQITKKAKEDKPVYCFSVSLHKDESDMLDYLKENLPMKELGFHVTAVSVIRRALRELYSNFRQRQQDERVR